ncbi:ArnT family glycosyltransferase [Xanthovirga aplysinae]|uniref:ArnT family glycosyltransferase n=1 Tax=Xanthovirga aplysinae TaxID=2529853 RepID=UPI0012BC6827|nr:glycosyltransferase family 39 protein [Xanthovirga aplysinae]MTI31794.1 hypothetical protein [Xanthovirga aplysinae]
MKGQHHVFFCFVLGLFIVITGPRLFSDGMFMDGLWYATISKNLANNLGTFWYPSLSKTLGIAFHEHPPLAFFLQSTFFKIFGNSLYIERVYSLLTFLMVGAIMVIIWKEITGKYAFSWLPLIYWITVPIVSWACANNMLENTMSIFICTSIFLYLKAQKRNRGLMLFSAGLTLLFGALTKGFIALFPWSFPFFYWIFRKKISFKRMLADTCIIIIFTILPFIFLLLTSPDAADSLQKYFNQQVVKSLREVQTVGSRFYILKRTFEELLPALIIILTVLLIAFKRSYSLSLLKNSFKTAFPFIFLSFSGVIPIMISLKQSGIYILPVFPFFTIALALISVDPIRYLTRQINLKGNWYKAFKYGSYLLFLSGVTLSLSQKDKIGRSKDIILDVYSIMEIVPSNNIVGLCKELRENWELYGYFHRYADISLDPNEKYQHKFHLGLKQGSSDKERILKNYHKVTLPLNTLVLYQLKEAESK